jgi:hypothetical protein
MVMVFRGVERLPDVGRGIAFVRPFGGLGAR